VRSKVETSCLASPLLLEVELTGVEFWIVFIEVCQNVDLESEEHDLVHALA
jgi:hypothetical protein